MVGGLTSYLAARHVKAVEWEQSVRREELREKKTLYAEFLQEASKIVNASFKEKFSDPSGFNRLSEAVSQLELLGSKPVCKAAKTVALSVTELHLKDPKNKVPSFSVARDVFVKAVKEELDEIKRI